MMENSFSLYRATLHCLEKAVGVNDTAANTVGGIQLIRRYKGSDAREYDTADIAAFIKKHNYCGVAFGTTIAMSSNCFFNWPAAFLHEWGHTMGIGHGDGFRTVDGGTAMW